MARLPDDAPGRATIVPGRHGADSGTALPARLRAARQGASTGDSGRTFPMAGGFTLPDDGDPARGQCRSDTRPGASLRPVRSLTRRQTIPVRTWEMMLETKFSDSRIPIPFQSFMRHVRAQQDDAGHIPADAVKDSSKRIRP